MTREYQHHSYLVEHVKHIVSQVNADNMYIELVKANLLDHVLRNDKYDDVIRLLNSALANLLSYEQALNTNVVIEEDIRPIRYTSSAHQSYYTSSVRKNSKSAVIDQIGKKLLAKQEKSFIREDRTIDEDIRPVRLVSHLNSF